MKKILMIVLVVCFLFSMSGCSGDSGFSKGFSDGFNSSQN